MAAITFAPLAAPPQRLWPLLVCLGAMLLAGLGAAGFMGTQGHHVTGMTNRVVWGLPHVLAIFLILAASGVLNVASVASVFGRTDYKPLAPLSALLAIALLVGGLAILVLDLGRPDRLLVAVTHQNPRSIFAWNILLYTGFLVVVGGYLATMLNRRLGRHGFAAGFTAFLWRLVLTTGTGCIFGFLAARALFHSAIMAPLFIAMSLAFGLAMFILLLPVAAWLGSARPGPVLLQRLGHLLAIFVAATFYLAVVLHAGNLYAPGGRALERFLLLDGGVYPALLWGGQVLLGTALSLLFAFTGRPVAAAGAVVLGGLAQLYLLIIGGQAFPQDLLPGLRLHSSFGDGEVAAYVPSAPELLLGLGGLAIAFLVAMLGCRLFRILPSDLPEPAA
jgi:molybdopterin-containing oxidoreductase family membrane subunit